jgi:heme/copper-type cytochrome/quinol oxidase subunit 1
MIMPLIFGAFGNFLLPTQLGVHDVAFPRLNSAAFWFLPGGLIMLMQLVCVDRVYKRMNCFNIRELQGILKRRFFTDLVNSADHRDILSSSMIGLRFKSNNTLNLDHDTLSFFKLGTTNSAKSRLSSYSNYSFIHE